MSHTYILTEEHGPVRLIRLNRPKALNALCAQLMRELGEELHKADADPQVRCIVLAGGERAFAAGADIKEMAPKDFQTVQGEDFITAEWEEIPKIRKPSGGRCPRLCVGRWV